MECTSVGLDGGESRAKYGDGEVVAKRWFFVTEGIYQWRTEHGYGKVPMCRS